MDHSASASIMASSFNMSANASVVFAAHAKLHNAALMSASGLVSPPPLEIDVNDSVSVEDDSDVKISTELLAYLRELDEVSKRLQQSAVEWGRQNPVLGWLLMIIAIQLVIKAIDSLLN